MQTHFVCVYFVQEVFKKFAKKLSEHVLTTSDHVTESSYQDLVMPIIHKYFETFKCISVTDDVTKLDKFLSLK